MTAYEEYRSITERAASSSSSAGGYGVPVLIDPTIILTSGAADAPVLSVCRVETITTDAWKGVSSPPPPGRGTPRRRPCPTT